MNKTELQEAVLALGKSIHDQDGKLLSSKQLSAALAEPGPDTLPTRGSASTPPPAPPAAPVAAKVAKGQPAKLEPTKSYRLVYGIMLDGIRRQIGEVVELTDAQVAPIPYAVELVRG